MASGVAVTSLKRTHSAEVAKDKIVSFCREVSFEKANGLRSGWIGDRCSGNLHKVLLELVNSIMNFTFMTSLSLSLSLASDSLFSPFEVMEFIDAASNNSKTCSLGTIVGNDFANTLVGPHCYLLRRRSRSIPLSPSHPLGVNHTRLYRSPENGIVQCLCVHPLNSRALYRMSCFSPSTMSSPPA